MSIDDKTQEEEYILALIIVDLSKKKTVTSDVGKNNIVWLVGFTMWNVKYANNYFITLNSFVLNPSAMLRHSVKQQQRPQKN